MPPKPMPHKDKKDPVSKKPATKSPKIALTDLQKVKVQIIDWKRCSVRSLLLIAYVTLVHFFAYAIIFAIFFHTIVDSSWLMIGYLSFYGILFLYFFGTGAAVNAITYVWNPVKFIMGTVTIIVAVIGNIVVWVLSNTSSAEYEGGLLKTKLLRCEQLSDGKLNDTDVTEEEKNYGATNLTEVCMDMTTSKQAMFCTAFVLPPVAVLCVVMSALAAVKALYITPRKYHKGSDVKIDAAWLEPYETYDFYVGRNIPQIPGYDGAYEGTVVDTAKFLEGSDEDEEQSVMEIDDDDDEEEVGGKKVKKGKKKKAAGGAHKKKEHKAGHKG